MKASKPVRHTASSFHMEAESSNSASVTDDQLNEVGNMTLYELLNHASQNPQLNQLIQAIFNDRAQNSVNMVRGNGPTDQQSTSNTAEPNKFDDVFFRLANNVNSARMNRNNSNPNLRQRSASNADESQRAEGAGGPPLVQGTGAKGNVLVKNLIEPVNLALNQTHNLQSEMSDVKGDIRLLTQGIAQLMQGRGNRVHMVNTNETPNLGYLNNVRKFTGGNDESVAQWFRYFETQILDKKDSLNDQQLAKIVPRFFEQRAEEYFHSLTDATKNSYQALYAAMRDGIDNPNKINAARNKWMKYKQNNQSVDQYTREFKRQFEVVTKGQPAGEEMKALALSIYIDNMNQNLKEKVFLQKPNTIETAREHAEYFEGFSKPSASVTNAVSFADQTQSSDKRTSSNNFERGNFANSSGYRSRDRSDSSGNKEKNILSEILYRLKKLESGDKPRDRSSERKYDRAPTPNSSYNNSQRSRSPSTSNRNFSNKSPSRSGNDYRDSRPTKRECFICGSTEHLANRCPQTKPAKQPIIIVNSRGQRGQKRDDRQNQQPRYNKSQENFQKSGQRTMVVTIDDARSSSAAQQPPQQISAEQQKSIDYAKAIVEKFNFEGDSDDDDDQEGDTATFAVFNSNFFANSDQIASRSSVTSKKSNSSEHNNQVFKSQRIGTSHVLLMLSMCLNVIFKSIRSTRTILRVILFLTLIQACAMVTPMLCDFESQTPSLYTVPGLIDCDKFADADPKNLTTSYFNLMRRNMKHFVFAAYKCTRIETLTETLQTFSALRSGEKHIRNSTQTMPVSIDECRRMRTFENSIDGPLIRHGNIWKTGNLVKLEFNDPWNLGSWAFGASWHPIKTKNSLMLKTKIIKRIDGRSFESASADVEKCDTKMDYCVLADGILLIEKQDTDSACEFEIKKVISGIIHNDFFLDAKESIAISFTENKTFTDNCGRKLISSDQGLIVESINNKTTKERIKREAEGEGILTPELIAASRQYLNENLKIFVEKAYKKSIFDTCNNIRKLNEHVSLNILEHPTVNVRTHLSQEYIYATTDGQLIAVYQCTKVDTYKFLPMDSVCVKAPRIMVTTHGRNFTGYLDTMTNIVYSGSEPASCESTRQIPITIEKQHFLYFSKTGKIEKIDESRIKIMQPLLHEWHTLSMHENEIYHPFFLYDSSDFVNRFDYNEFWNTMKFQQQIFGSTGIDVNSKDYNPDKTLADLSAKFVSKGFLGFFGINFNFTQLWYFLAVVYVTIQAAYKLTNFALYKWARKILMKQLENNLTANMNNNRFQNFLIRRYGPDSSDRQHPTDWRRQDVRPIESEQSQAESRKAPQMREHVAQSSSLRISEIDDQSVSNQLAITYEADPTENSDKRSSMLFFFIGEARRNCINSPDNRDCRTFIPVNLTKTMPSGSGDPQQTVSMQHARSLPDTGSPCNVITTGIIDNDVLQTLIEPGTMTSFTGASGDQINVLGTISFDVDYCSENNLELPDQDTTKINALEFHVFESDFPIIILGKPWFEHHKWTRPVEIDLVNHAVRVYTPGGMHRLQGFCESTPFAPPTIVIQSQNNASGVTTRLTTSNATSTLSTHDTIFPVIKRRWQEELPVVNGTVENVQYLFLLDSGSTINLIGKSLRGLLKNIVECAETSYGITGHTIPKNGRAQASIKLDHKLCPEIKTEVEILDYDYPFIILGTKFLKHMPQPVAIDYDKSCVYFGKKIALKCNLKRHSTESDTCAFIRQRAHVTENTVIPARTSQLVHVAAASAVLSDFHLSLI